MTKIEELEQKLDNAVEKFRLEMNECKKALAELKESKKEGKWKPALREQYWFRNVYGVFDWCKNGEQKIIDWQYNNVPIFKTREECEKYWHFMDTVKEKSYEFSKDDFIEWGIKKYFIYYDYRVEQVKVGNEFATKDFNKPYFKTEEDAQYIIDNFKEELLKFFL